MYSFLVKNGQALAFGLGLLLVLLFAITAFPTAGNTNFDTMPDAEKFTSNIFSVGLLSAIVLTVIAAIGMVVFGVVQVASTFSTSWKGIAGFAAILVIFFIAYSTAGSLDDASPYIQAAVKKFESNGAVLSPGNFKFISGAITTTLTMIALAAVSFIGSLVYQFFK